jgi:hypothetical protein
LAKTGGVIREPPVRQFANLEDALGAKLPDGAQGARISVVGGYLVRSGRSSPWKFYTE